MDPLTRQQRSYCMSRIRSKGTAPELMVRSMLRRARIRFRSNAKHLPGSPDFILLDHKVAIFVHGCFWHRHPGCKFTTTPKTRGSFWAAKFKANVSRDRRTARLLRKDGWRVFTVWACRTQAFGRNFLNSLGNTRSTASSSTARKPNQPFVRASTRTAFFLNRSNSPGSSRNKSAAEIDRRSKV